MKHFVVMCDWAMLDGNGFASNGADVTGVAHSLEEAKEIFAKAVIDEKEYAEDNNWTIHEDSDVEFDAGEEGNYTEEHAHFYIQEVM